MWGVMLASIVFSGLAIWFLAHYSINDESDYKKYTMSAYYAVQIAANQGEQRMICFRNC